MVLEEERALLQGHMLCLNEEEAHEGCHDYNRQADQATDQEIDVQELV